MTRILTTIIMVVAFVTGAAAQVVTTAPALITTDSSPITITFHADRGSRGLAGLGADQAVYAHTGVISSASVSSTDWQHAPMWLDNSAKYRLKYVEANTWELVIPSIKDYYGLTDEELKSVTKLMFVFRNANGSREGKTATGSDIAIDVRPAGFHVSISISDGSRVVSSNRPVTITATSSAPAEVSLTIGGKTASGNNSATLTTTFPDPGKYTAIATAVTASGATAADTLSMLRLAGTQTAAYPLGEIKQGAVTAADGTSATFALAAPGKQTVLLVGSWNDFALDPDQQMCLATETVEIPTDTACIKNAWSLRQPYFWTTVDGLEPGREYSYYYLIDGEKAVGDPYARLVLDPEADRFISPEVFPDMPEYPTGKVPENTILAILSTSATPAAPKPLTNRPDADNLIIYELLIRDFTGDGTGNGNIAGVIDRLDYIESLGVNAVELMPVMEFGGNNSWGYNPLFYFAPDKAYGTPADYRRLVEEIHSRGMAVILDVVFNHADSRNPRRLMYEASMNPFFNATPPHSYNAFHDWNQDNPLVMNQWIDALRYWTEVYGVDGFRFDMVKGMGANGSYGIAWDRTDNSFASPSEATTNRYNASRVERMKRLKDALAEVAPDAYFICEDLATAEEDKGLASFGAKDWANVNHGACQWAMGWSDGADLARFYAPLDGGRPHGSTVSYAESHDEERMAYKQLQWAQADVKASPDQQMRRLGSVAAFMLLSPGSHMIWQFEELGDAQPVKKADGNNNTDPRKEAWSLLDNPLNASLHDTYAALISLRRDNPDLFAPDVKVEICAVPSFWSSGYSLSLTSPTGKSLILTANPHTSSSLRVSVAEGHTAILASPGVDYEAGKEIILLPGAFVVTSTEATGGINLPGADVPAPCRLFTPAGIEIDPSGKLTPGVYISVDRSGRASKISVR